MLISKLHAWSVYLTASIPVYKEDNRNLTALIFTHASIYALSKCSRERILTQCVLSRGTFSESASKGQYTHAGSVVMLAVSPYRHLAGTNRNEERVVIGRRGLDING